MEKIKIRDTEYEIIRIMPTAPNVLQIVFADNIPREWGILPHLQSEAWRQAI